MFISAVGSGRTEARPGSTATLTSAVARLQTQLQGFLFLLLFLHFLLLSFQKHTGWVLEIWDSTFGSRAPPSVFSSKLHHFNANSYVPAVFQTCIETHYFCVVLFDEKKLNKMKIATSVRDRMPLHHLCHCLALRFCLSVEVQRWGSTHLWAPVVLYLSSVHG